MVFVAVFFAVLVLYMLVVFRHPACAAGGVFCLYGMKQWGQASSSFLADHRAIANFAFAGVVGFAWVVAAARHRVAWRYSQVAVPMFGIFALAAASYYWCVAPWAYMGTWIYAIPYLTVYVLIAPLLIQEPEDGVKALWALLLFGFGLILLLEYTVSWHGRGLQLVDYTALNFNKVEESNPLAIATMGSSVFLVAVLLRVERYKRAWAFFRWPIAIYGLAISVQSGSRGQVSVALLCAFAFIGYSRGTKDIRQILLFVFVNLFLAGIAFYFYTEFAAGNARWDLQAMSDAVQVGRIDNCVKLLNFWGDGGPFTWIFGIGSSGSFDASAVGFYPEVVPVEILCEEGLIGFALWSTMVALVFLTFNRARLLVENSPKYRGVLATFGALSVFHLLLSCKEGSFLGWTDGLACILLLGQFEAALRRSQQLQLGYSGDDLNINETDYAHQPYASAY